MNDQELIEKAWQTHCTDWDTIDGLIRQASTEETKEQLRSIQSYKYHQEEYICGL